MIQYILKRLFYGVLVLFGVITVIFLLFNVLPGDPARMMLGQRADIASVEAINHDLGLDQPLYKQYLGFLNDLSPISVHNYKNEKSFWYLDSEKYVYSVLFTVSNQKWVIKKPYLRRSYQTKRRVSEILAEAFPKTMLLATVSIIFAVVLGIFMGVIIVVKKNNFLEKISMVFSVLGMSLPSFFVAIIFAWVFGFLLADITGLSMFGSLYTVDDLGRGVYLDLKNLILPAITLGIRPLAIVVELTKSSLQDVLSQDFIRTAKAKGLSQYKIITRHAMRNAMNPVITAVSGWFASLMAGAVFVEYVFDWKGVGVVIVDALEKYDFPVIMGAVLVISILLVIINIMVDIIYAFLDPRVRYA